MYKDHIKMLDQNKLSVLKFNVEKDLNIWLVFVPISKSFLGRNLNLNGWREKPKGFGYTNKVERIPPTGATAGCSSRSTVGHPKA